MLALSMLFSFFSFSQDGYHVLEEPKCQEKSCLLVDEVEIGFYSFSDLEGNRVEKMNSNSAFTDLFRPGAPACYKGDPKRIKQILQALAGNNEREYLDGGHAVLRRLEVSLSGTVLKVFGDVRSDYNDYTLRFQLKPCL